jgi:hypothetical protein
LSKDFGQDQSHPSIDVMLQISVSNGLIQMDGPEVDPKMMRLALDHMDQIFLRAAELNNHTWQQMLYVSGLSPLDALTLLQ